MARAARRRAERRGRRAEAHAAIWLRLKGYAVLARRVKLPVGEIDLIARRGRTLAFVEVKHRRTRTAAQIAVPDGAWRRISRAAESWASQQHGADALDWRYDLIAITPWHLPKHYKDYWRP